MKIQKMLLTVLAATLTLPSFAVPYIAVRGAAGASFNDVNQWQYAPSVTNPTQGEMSVIKAGTSSRTSEAVQLAVGTTLADNLRAEIEYAYNGTVKLDGNFDYHINTFTLPTAYELKTTIQTLGINVYYDFHNNTAFTPYIGTGVGIAATREKAQVKNSFAQMSAKDYYYTLAWNVNAGVGYAVSERLTLDLGIRYSVLGDKETTQYGGADNYFSSTRRENNSLLGSLGIRYSF